MVLGPGELIGTIHSYPRSKGWSTALGNVSIAYHVRDLGFKEKHVDSNRIPNDFLV